MSENRQKKDFPKRTAGARKGVPERKTDGKDRAGMNAPRKDGPERPAAARKGVPERKTDGKNRAGTNAPRKDGPERPAAARKGAPGGGTARRGGFGRPASAPGRREGGFRGKPAPAPEKAKTDGLPSRRAALKVLREVTEEGAYASLSLDRTLQGSGLSGADRRLATRLIYDTLDHLEYLDYMLGQVMAREDTDIRLRNVLRLGACQVLLEDRIPESAATNTSVQLCAEIGLEGLKGVCNGILRNLVRKKDELQLPDREKEPGRYFAVKYSIPEWLGERLRADWGEEAVSIASRKNHDGPVTIRRNLMKTDEAAFEKILEKKVWGREKGALPGAWRITGAMDIARDADFLSGAFSIQSESSMMACLALDVRRGMQVLDCCAAPGGKSCFLSELMGDTGRVQAWDLHEHRVQLIAAQQKRLGLENIRPIQRDAARYREDLETRMDAVLLDAPCSGLGVLAEKPDIRLRITEESLSGLIELQGQLLETVCRYVKPGGTLVYSTCSILKDENERRIRAFLDAHPEFRAEPLPESIPEQFRKYQELGLQLLPHRDGVEGFYICRMRRREE